MQLHLVGVHGNSATATRLQTARNITLSGDVTGSASFNGSANVTITTNLANVAVLTGTITADGTETISKTMNYPNGYTRDNCVVLTVNLQRTANLNKGYGLCFDSSSYVTGAIPARVVMNEKNIFLGIRNVLIINEGLPSVPNIASGTSFSYTIMLMKI